MTENRRVLIQGSVVAAAIFIAAGSAAAGPKGPHPTKPPHATTVKPAKAVHADPVDNKDQKNAIKQDIKGDKRDIKQDQAELKRLRADLKDAQKAGDTVRAARDRRAIADMEAHIRADRGEIKDDKSEEKAIGKKPKGKPKPQSYKSK